MKPEGNVLNSNDCVVMRCSFADISHIFKKFHYKGDAMGGGISFCFAMFIHDQLVGGSVTGLPRHQDKYKNAIDIRRMALLDSSPTNSESFFLGQIIRFIASNTSHKFVLSYSDFSVGHEGTIYRAANFKKIGETAPTKWIEWNGKTYHMRSLTIERPYSYALREAVKNGEALICTGLVKSIWLYEISKKMMRKKFNLPMFGDVNQMNLFQ